MKTFYIACVFTIVTTLIVGCKSTQILKPKELVQSYYNNVKYINNGDTLNYRILYPQDFDLSKSYPLVLFLHGAGERGDDNQAQLKHIAPLFQEETVRNQYPAIVIFPQCPEDDYWAKVDRTDGIWTAKSSEEATRAMQLVISLMDKFKSYDFVNKRRMYLAGLSMGGFGTFDYLIREPETFAAAIAICGGADLDKIDLINNMPLRIYHGAQDPVVPVELSRKAYAQLVKGGSTKIEYKEYPAGGHDIWTQAMTELDQFDWLFSQVK